MRGLAHGGAVEVAGQASSVPCALAPGRALPPLSACCLGQSIRITWSLVNPQGLGPVSGDAESLGLESHRSWLSDISPGDTGAT